MDTHIIMSRKETKYAEILHKAEAEGLKNREGAEMLHLSIRQLQRLKRAFREEGLKGLVHRSRGKPSNRKMPDEERRQMVALIKTRYPDFGPTFAGEKLREKHQIFHDPKTIRSIMIAEGLWKPKRKKKQVYRAWRERRPCYGEMQQYDGSYEYWFEERGEKCCLLASIDDAAGSITHAKFDAHEGVFPTFRFWQEYLEKHGKPLSVYVDKFSTYSMNHKLAKENPDTLTQFQRAMRELGIEPICAHSSPAKGRVERLFGTLQDRLIKELRLQDISTIPEANVFLEKIFIPDFNRRFSVSPRETANMHHPLTEKERASLPAILSRQSVRIIRNDFTIAYRKSWYQLAEDQPVTVFKKNAVIVEERLDGTTCFRLRGKYLLSAKLPFRPQKATPRRTPWALTKKPTYHPSKDHPWRKFDFAHH